MKIACMSDSHNNWDNLSLAITIANQDECDVLLFAGDLTVPAGIEKLSAFDGPVHYIHGNGESGYGDLEDAVDKTENVHYHGEAFDSEINGVSVYMHHYPDQTKEAAESGEYGLCVYGHTHEFKEDGVGDTVLLNPGVLQGRRGRVGFAIFHASEGVVEEVKLAH